MKKWLKITLISLASIIVIIIGMITFVIHFVFTPSKITPIVGQIANDNINGKLTIENVELTFFSSFPNFSLKLSNGSLQVDSLYAASHSMQTDTIISFVDAQVTINPMAYLNNKKVEVKNVSINQPHLYAYISDDGKPNWDIIKPTEVVMQDTTIEVTTELNSIDLDNLSIEGGSIVFDDRSRGMYSRLYELDMSLSGDYNKQKSDLKYKMSFDRGLFYMNNELMFKKISLSMNADMTLDKEHEELRINSSDVTVNTTQLSLSGSVKDDYVDLQTALKVNSLSELMAMIPTGLIENNAKIHTSGEVAVNAHIVGKYKNGRIPTAEMGISINQATLQYDGYKNKIDNLTVNATGFIDLNADVRNGYLSLDKFYLKGASTEIDVTGEVRNILQDPKIMLSMKSDINLTELYATIPFKKAISMGGRANINIKGATSMSQIEKKDYANIRAEGTIEFDNLFLRDKDKDFDCSITKSGVGLSNDSSGLLSIIGGMGNLKCTVADRAKLTLDSIIIHLKGVKSKDTAYLNGDITYKNFFVSVMHDSMRLRSKDCKIELTLAKESKLKFVTDSLSVRLVNTRMRMTKAGITIRKTKDSLSGYIGFKDIKIKSAMFPLPIGIQSTVFTLKDNKLALKRAQFTIGDSDMTITGELQNLGAYIKDSLPLIADVLVTSDKIDLSQLIRSLNFMNAKIEEWKEKKDTQTHLSEEELDNNHKEAHLAMQQDTTVQILAVPDNINLTFNSDLKKVIFENQELNNVKGKITMADNTIKLRGLGLTALGARMRTRASYWAKDTTSAKATFTLNIKDVNIHRVVESAPILDSLMPMMRSFDGDVNLNFSVDANFKAGFEPDLNSLQSALNIDGKNLVLLDGETFAEISKMLMFKNKKKNMVDSINMHISVKDGAIEVYPFVFSLDRYRVAVGGKHKLDNHFNYHVSVLKSPIPIKFGLNITGTLEQMKFGVGKTKYKHMGDPNYKLDLNPEYIKIRQSIMQKIRDIEQ